MFSQDYRNYVDRFLAKTRPGYHQEVEIRFKQLTDDGTLQTYPKQAFVGLLNQMKKIDPRLTETLTIDKSYEEPQRKEFRDPHFNNTVISVGKEEKSARTKLKFKSDRVPENLEYGYSIGFAYERELELSDPLVTSKGRGPAPIIRSKHRHSFMMNGNRLDMTKVSDQKSENYEIEFELLDPTDLNRFFNTATQIYMMLNDTITMYSLIEKREAFREVNTILRHGFEQLSNKTDLIKDYKRNRVYGTLDMEHLVQARNLKSDDLAYKGLIPPPFIDDLTRGMKPAETIETYTVTHKADGFRKLLYINKVGLWLLMSGDANLVARMDFNREYMYTILDGELIPQDKRRPGAPETLFWYLIFDNLNSTIPTRWNEIEAEAVAAGTSIQKAYHYQRLAESESIAQKLTNDIITIETKSFKAVTHGNNPYSFFEVMRKMFREQQFERFETDGFMFTPVKSVYMIDTDKKLIEQFKKDNRGRYPRDCEENYEYISKNRNLTRYPDICKWKPPALMTVDLALKWVATTDGKRALELYAKNTNPATKRDIPYILFRGTSFNPFRGGMIDFTQELLALPAWTVVEFAWDDDKQKLILHKVRLDKTFPNSCEVAMDVWDIMLRASVTKETLMGESFDMVRRFHNQIKSGLFYANANPRGILLDIGSGRGGDVHKWKPNFDQIISVEPNREHIEELTKRVTEAKMGNRVTIVPTGGEDYENITSAMNGRKANVISMMLSMSFFWNTDKPEMLEALARTIVDNIAPDGKVIFLTQDGRALSEMFLPSFSGLAIEELKLGPATIKVDGYTVDIHIEETIVQNQREYLVFIYDLVTQINLITETETGARLDYFKTAFADDRFMTEAENTYSQIFASGVISFGQSDVLYKNFLIKNFDLSKMSEESKIPYTSPSKPEYGTDGKLKPITVDKSDLIEINETTYKASGDDELSPIAVQGYDGQAYRIGTIGEGSCFFHAFAKAVFPEYQNDPDYTFRHSLIRLLRYDFSVVLRARFKKEKKTNYYLVNNGSFPRINEEQLKIQQGIKETEAKLKTKLTEKQRNYYENELKEYKQSVLVDMYGKPIDYSEEGLAEYIYDENGNDRDVGDDIIAYVTSSKPAITNVAVIVIQCFNNGCRYVYDTIDPDVERPIIVISGDGSHYETVGVERVKENGDVRLSTMFFPDDPFIEALLKLKKTN